MITLTITAKNGIAVSDVVLLNPNNIILYNDNLAGFAVIRYDTDPNGKDNPINYTTTTTKSAIDALIPDLISVTMLDITIIDQATGVTTESSLNQKYISQINTLNISIAGVISSKTSILYSDGGFVSKRIYISDDIGSLTYITPNTSGGVVSSQYTIYTDPDSGLLIRSGIRNDVYTVDKELTATGFDGEKDKDWEVIGGAI